MKELLDFAKSYFRTKLNTDVWDNEDDLIKLKWLAEATRQLKSIQGINIPKNLNDDLKTAICEICYEIINSSDSETFNKLQRAGVTSISYGNDSVSFNSSSSISKTNNNYVNDYAYSLLLPYIQRSYRIV